MSWGLLAALLSLPAMAMLLRWRQPAGSEVSAEQHAREMFKQAVAYPRRIEPSRPVTVVVRHRCGTHAEQTRKWV